MKKKESLGVSLACVTGAALLAAMLLRTFLPRLILPRLDATCMVVLSLLALLFDHYLARETARNYWLIPLYGAVAFGLFPFAAAFTAPMSALTFAVLGAAVFTAVTFLFDTMADRLSTGPVAKLAPVVSALGLYLACQCLMGII